MKPPCFCRRSSVRRDRKEDRKCFTVTDKGHATLPKALRDALCIAPGSRVEFTLQPDGIARMRVLPSGFAGLDGLHAQPGEAAWPLEALDDAVAKKVKARHPAR